MNSEIEITLTGDGIPNFVPCGATISYGINRIPVASVQLDPKALPLFCDFDSIRRKNAKLTVKAGGTCIVFDGVIDGHSMSQHPGGITTALILKHKFTLLNEVFPRMLGLSSGSSNLFGALHALQTDPKPGDDAFMVNVQKIYGISGLTLNQNSNMIDYIVELAKVVVRSQDATTPIAIGAAAERSSVLNDVIKESDLMKHKMFPIVLDLLNSIDTSYCSRMNVAANTPMAADVLSADIAAMNTTVFANILNQIHEFGACLVIGNSKSYIIPEASFLKIPKYMQLSRGKTSNAWNIVLPSEYENFSFSDSGENTIKGVYVIEDPNSSLNTLNSTISKMSGKYVDPSPNVFGNIVCKRLPRYATLACTCAAGMGSLGQHRRIKGGQKLIDGKIDFNNYLQGNQSTSNQTKEIGTSMVETFLNDYAELEYCRIKYEDRTGSINTYFSNIFVPGAIGSIYTREPGTYIDFFVTGVNHSFSLHAPKGGSANTSVTFKGGRMGASNNVGIDRVGMYDYTYQDAQDFCGDFISNISI